MNITETMNPNENLILIYYVGVANIDLNEIEEYMKNIRKRIVLPFGNGILIPVSTSFDVKVECINPKYITDSELIEEHEKLMKELNDNLKIQKKILDDEIQKKED